MPFYPKSGRARIGRKIKKEKKGGSVKAGSFLSFCAWKRAELFRRGVLFPQAAGLLHGVAPEVPLLAEGKVLVPAGKEKPSRMGPSNFCSLPPASAIRHLLGEKNFFSGAQIQEKGKRPEEESGPEFFLLPKKRRAGRMTAPQAQRPQRPLRPGKSAAQSGQTEKGGKVSATRSGTGSTQ